MGITFTAQITCQVCGHKADCVVEVTHNGRLRPSRVPGQAGWQWRYGDQDEGEDTLVTHCPDHQRDDGGRTIWT